MSVTRIVTVAQVGLAVGPLVNGLWLSSSRDPT
jgi:hypothetical protein